MRPSAAKLLEEGEFGRSPGRWRFSWDVYSEEHRQSVEDERWEMRRHTLAELTEAARGFLGECPRRQFLRQWHRATGYQPAA